MPYTADQYEKEILSYWQEKKIFEKSVASRPDNKPYIFYDGPPFATGLPHYGHILSSVIKDVVPRYWTMKGYQVRRRWGWDCHGLPIESLIEKELKISGKKQIEDMGIAAFNNACRSKVLMYTQEWKAMVDRIGRWIEFDNAYKTMDPTYMESVWWALKKIWDKGQIYEGRKVLLYCTRCETPVSKAETVMDNSYKDVTEEAVTIKFKVTNPEAHGLPANTYILAWTTTPWTLPGNVALAVGKDIEYVLVRASQDTEENYYIIAQERAAVVLKKLTGSYTEEKKFTGKDLLGIEYEPLFPVPAIAATGKKAYYVAAGDFVTTTDGTGIVHTAVAYGEDDYTLGVANDLPVVPMLNSQGHFTEAAPDFIQGQYLKKAEKEIKQNLTERNLLLLREQNTHSYPHCWRCDTPLIYNAISAWFIDIQRIKQRLIELNENISWYPDHLKHGRFLNILETAPDWNISRNRYWATPLPFWKCVSVKSDGSKCQHTTCIGSVQELKDQAVNFAAVYSTDVVAEMDLHKEHMDQIRLRCAQCGGEMERIPEVIDCWVEAASMPFAELHYPFANETMFQERFPGQYIAEYIAQTRAWFYYMHVMGTLLFDTNTFEHVVTTGTILNEKGEKLSKSKKNYTDPWLIIGDYGMDTLRYYLMTSVVMQADNLFFNDRDIRDIYNKVVNMLWNVVTFFLPFTTASDGKTKAEDSTHVLDQWILAKLHLLVKEVTTGMDAYDTVRAGRPLRDFIDELSTWYLRRSRDRFKGEDEKDKRAAIATLQTVLLTLAKLMAPFTPFIAEKMYLALQGSLESVHLEEWPTADEKLITKYEPVLVAMAEARKIVEMGLALRAEAGIKVRQPLTSLYYQGPALANDFLNIIADEMNVLTVTNGVLAGAEAHVQKSDQELTVSLATTITPELKKQGLLREVVRAINQQRKELGLTPHDKVMIEYRTDDQELAQVLEEYEKEILRQVRGEALKAGGTTEVMVDGKPLWLNIVVLS